MSVARMLGRLVGLLTGLGGVPLLGGVISVLLVGAGVLL